MKKIDTLLIRSFVPPFVLAFFIAIFVLVMQFLWNFIDEIIGKGVSTIDLVELLFYRSLSLFPLALPIGVLLAGVMVFGNLSEKYELSSLKSAGVSLLRIMLPVIALGGLVALFSIFCSNTLIPLSNLKFQSRLYDIRNQKPALSLEEGVFNDDFRGFSIRIGKKYPDNRRIEDILIYDQSSSTRRQYSMLHAERGEMFISDDGRDFVMKLYDGMQYQELQRTTNAQGFPFARTAFDEWTKQFDLSEFELSYTDEELFKSHHSMKSVKKLLYEIDTIEVQYARTLERGYHDFNNVLTNRVKAGLVKPDTMAAIHSQSNGRDTLRPDDSRVAGSGSETPLEINVTPQRSVQPSRAARAVSHQSALIRVLDTIDRQAPWSSVLAAIPAVTRKQYERTALTRAKNLRDNSRRLITTLEVISSNRAMHIFELHFKFSIAAICVIFLFIGAPMGAIVRKGGYGYPLLVAIIFFTLYIILNLMFKKFAETESLPPALAAWAPCIIMLPISIYLTHKAMNDTKMLDINRYLKPLYKRFARNAEATQT
ncbi:MAG: LptF/LptG family permease [Saprospiraceae bacterium]|nr:LptF/LptG family permease [Saprospiraceae bacterium]